MHKAILTIGALALVTLIDAQPAQAIYEGPWCAFERAGRGVIGRRCDLKSYEACRAWMNASPGTWCTENPHFRVAEQPARRKVKQRVQ